MNLPSKKRVAAVVAACAGLSVVGFVGYLFLMYVVGFAGPYKVEQFVEIGPSETAFVVPLERDTLEGQTRTLSVENLKALRVKAKRVSLPLRKKWVGRMPGSFEWVPIVAVRKVNRAPVSREWRHTPQAGSPVEDDALFCETADGIKLFSGCAIAARILEEDAHLHLYHYGERSLTTVIDTNIRGFCQMELAKIVKRERLEVCQRHKAEQFRAVFELARSHFKREGITLDFLGNDGGYEFQNPRVQSSIDSTHIVSIGAQVAEQERLAQDVRNTIAVGAAEATRQAAELQLENRDAVEFTLRLDILAMQADARKSAAKQFAKAGGHLPANILPAGSAGPAGTASPALLMQLPAPK